MKRKVKREAMVMGLRSLGESKNPEILKCRDAAAKFAQRIQEAKTEKERDQIRAEFDRWTETDPTFRRILLGLHTLLD